MLTSSVGRARVWRRGCAGGVSEVGQKVRTMQRRWVGGCMGVGGWRMRRMESWQKGVRRSGGNGPGTEAEGLRPSERGVGVGPVRCLIVSSVIFKRLALSRRHYHLVYEAVATTMILAPASVMVTQRRTTPTPTRGACASISPEPRYDPPSLSFHTTPAPALISSGM